LRLAGNLGQFWAVRGYTTEGRRLLGKALDHAGDFEDSGEPGSEPFRIRLIALNNAGIMAREQGDYADARRRHTEQLALVRARNDEAQIARALSNLGSVAMQEGDAVQAGSLFEDSLAIRRRLGDARAIAYSVNNLGVLADHNGEDDKARAYFEEHLRIMRELGDTRAVAHSLANLGMTAVAFGELDEAATMVAEARTLMESLGDNRGVAISRLNDAYISLVRHRRAGTAEDEHGLVADAGRQYHAALRVLAELDDAPAVRMALEGLAAVAAAQGDGERAIRLLGAAGQMPSSIGEQHRVEQEMRARTLAQAEALLGHTAAAVWAEAEASDADQIVAALIREPAGGPSPARGGPAG
jgi:tetratricopeptide (TPR) repeat protein